MKSPLVTSLFSAALIVSLPAFAQSVATSTASAEKSPAPARRDTYPLKACVVSDEKLDGEFVTYVHQEAGKPDREVRFCCEGCIEDFKQNPAKFLKKLDDAAKAQARTPPAATPGKR